MEKQEFDCQEFDCKEGGCDRKVIFYPSKSTLRTEKRKTIAYLTCEEGHRKSYTVVENLSNNEYKVKHFSILE